MKDKIWEVAFEGYKIKAINKLAFFPPKTSEVLEVNGEVVKHKKGSFFSLHTKIVEFYNFNGIEKEVEIRFAQKRMSFGMGCQILIDGKQIGGDKVINYPDPKKAEEHLKNGFSRYFIRTGLLTYGLMYATLMRIFNGPEDGFYLSVFIFFLHMFGFGGIMSYFAWNGFKSAVKTSGEVNSLKT